MKKAIIPIVIFLITASLVSAEVRLVPGDYPTIDAAVSACSDGDEVVVADGIYRGDGNRDLHINRNITIRSENGPDGCIIDCNGTETEQHQGFYLNENRVIAGFTIINGYAQEGGAINCGDGSPTVINCVITDNSAEREGGGIYCHGGSPIIINCRITGNSAECGGGIYSEYSNPTIKNCIIKDNSATGDHWPSGGGGNMAEAEGGFGRDDSLGGGIYCGENSNLTVVDSAICNNIVRGGISSGGGIACGQSNPIITGCVISGNFGFGRYKRYGGGIYCTNSSAAISNCTIVGNSFYGLHCRGGSADVINSILCYNGRDDKTQIDDHGNVVNVKYSDVWTDEPSYCPWPGEGNINADPCFVESGYWDDNGTSRIWNDDFWVDGNYRLLATSPCIDAGRVTSYLIDSTDLDGNPRIVNNIVDIGTYEYQLLSPVALLLDLIYYIDELSLHRGTANSLQSKLYAALEKLEDDDQSNDGEAVDILGALINAVEAQYGKKIPEADADFLIDTARRAAA